jgi:3-hydroxy-3-methylglutaryl CoA synthase
VQECYEKLKGKCKNKNILAEMDYLCFHCPFYKMVLKAYHHLARL